MLAVVDPGVGTDRRAVAIEVAGGDGVLVGPDNGLLAPAVAMAGGAERAVELTNPEYQLAAPGATFAGRDVFAPAAAHLCNGVELHRARRRGRPGVAACPAPCRCPATTATRRRRGAVGRPVRQLPAQRRPRRSRRSTCVRRRRAAVSCASATRPRRRRVGRTRRSSRRTSPPSAAASRAGARLVRDAGGLPRPALGRRGARPRRRRPGRCSTPLDRSHRRQRHRVTLRADRADRVGSLRGMRPATTLTLAPAAGGDPGRRHRSRSSGSDRRRRGAIGVGRAVVADTIPASWGERGATCADEPGPSDRRHDADARGAHQPQPRDHVRRAARPGRPTARRARRLGVGRRRPRRDRVRQQPLLRRSSYLATLGLGAVAVPLNPTSPAPELAARDRRSSSRSPSSSSRRSSPTWAEIDRHRGAVRRARRRRPRVKRRTGRRTLDELLAAEPSPVVDVDARPPRRADVHQRHRRRAAGGDAQPRQPARQHRAERSAHATA